MGGGWWILVIGGLVVGWAIYLDIRHDTDKRLARWWVPRARRQGRWAGPLSFLMSLGLLAAYATVALVGASIASAAGDKRWALLTALPAMLAYVPFNFATMPTQYGSYGSWRKDLAAAGAEPRLQRAIAWWAGPPSLLGMVAMVATLLPIFLD